MKATGKIADPEGELAQLSQEATNQSTPDKALEEQPKRPVSRRKIAPKRNKVPNAERS